MTEEAQVSCPVCRRRHRYSRQALECWLAHEPDLPLGRTAREIGVTLGVSGERILQFFRKMGETRRSDRQVRAMMRAGDQEAYSGEAARGEGAARGGTRAAMTDEALDRRRRYDRERERDPVRKEYKKRRHQERMATDPAYRELKRAKSRRKYERRKARRAAGEGEQPAEDSDV